MKRVIDISEQDYDVLKTIWKSFNTDDHVGRLLKAIYDSTECNSDDCISRDSALDIVSGTYEKDDFGESNFYKAISKLPSTFIECKGDKSDEFEEWKLNEDKDCYLRIGDIVDRFKEIDEHYNHNPWTLTQIFSNLNVLQRVERKAEDCIYVDVDKVLNSVVEWVASGENQYTNATSYLVKRIQSLPNVTLKDDEPILSKEPSVLEHLMKYSRDLTPEEREVYNNALDKISTPTGVTLQGLMDGETYIPESVLEDIKADLQKELRDINSNITEFSGSDPVRFFNKGINKAIDIVNKHINRKDLK